MQIVIVFFSYVILTLHTCASWRAIPANQAVFAARSGDIQMIEDAKLPRDYLDQIHKFGYCTRDTVQRAYLRKSVNVTLSTYQDTQLTYIYVCVKNLLYLINTEGYSFLHRYNREEYLSVPNVDFYLLERKETVRFFQCIVMKSYVPEKFLFLKSNLHLYYCQGIAFVLMMNTINRYEIHEFFLGPKLNMPMNFVFEFYHPEYVTGNRPAKI